MVDDTMKSEFIAERFKDNTIVQSTIEGFVIW